MVKILYISILSIIILFLPSCVSNLELISEDVYLVNSDKSNSNSKTYEGALINLKAGTITRSKNVQIRLGFIKKKNQGTWVIKTIYSNNFGWWYTDNIRFSINSAKYFEFNTLPNPVRLTDYPEPSSYILDANPTRDKNYYEENLFIISPQLCDALLKANQLSITLINPNNGWLEGDLEKEDIKKLKNFIEYIDSNVLGKK